MYLRCDTPGCGWSQDDFWELFVYRKWQKKWWKRFGLGYSPVKNIVDLLIWLWKPRYIGMDSVIIYDYCASTKIKIKVKTVIEHVVRNGKTYKIKDHRVFSWQWLLLELIIEYRKFRHQRWWTYRDWLRNKDTAVCPKCGKSNFVID